NTILIPLLEHLQHYYYSLLLLSFLLYASAHPRDLHSFPTRRSSDLRWCSAGGSRPKSARSSCGRWTPPARRCTGGAGTNGHSTLDRKSTRLNSSHVSISYAVFCLKKKKK